MNWIKIEDRDPDRWQRIAAKEKNTGAIHIGGYYIETGKICLEQGIKYELGGTCCCLEENYSHWSPLPKEWSEVTE